MSMTAKDAECFGKGAQRNARQFVGSVLTNFLCDFSPTFAVKA